MLSSIFKKKVLTVFCINQGTPNCDIDLCYIYSWYREIHRKDAEDLLLNRSEDGDYIQPDGAFLVRPTESSPGDFTVSVK